VRPLGSFVTDDVDVFLAGDSGSWLRRLFLLCCDAAVTLARDELLVLGDPVGDLVSIITAVVGDCSDSSFRRV
jgi:hypothetical protein